LLFDPGAGSGTVRFQEYVAGHEQPGQVAEYRNKADDGFQPDPKAREGYANSVIGHLTESVQAGQSCLFLFLAYGR
jgi:hypothetical protein